MGVHESEKRTEELPQRLASPEKPSQSVPPSSPQKKTRDLPNLTECHACGFKVDVCTGKNKLRILSSEWRVVLLCNKCFSSVESSQICSYCFSGASPECFRCIHCRHSVHKSCFHKYKNVAPWSYSCLGSEFSVCVDCWIPKPLEVSRRRRRRKLRSGMIEKKGKVVIEKGGSKVLGDGNYTRSMEDVVKDSNRAVEKKVEAATRARDVAMKKAGVAKRAVALANKALSLVVNREVSALNLLPKMDPVKVVTKSKVFDLHSHLNRISKSPCLLNTSYLDVPKRCTFSVDSLCKTTNSRNASGCDDEHRVSNGDTPNGDSHKSLCEPSVSVGSLDTDSSTGRNRLCMGRADMKGEERPTVRPDRYFLKYSRRNGLKLNPECIAEFDVEEIGEEMLKEGEGSCSDRMVNLGGEDSGLELDRKQTNCSLHGDERPTVRPDRYFLKYSRRNGLKPNLECIAEFDVEKIGEEMLKEGEGSCSDRLINLGAEDSGLELDCKQTDCSLHREEGPTARPDRYFFLKYSRRKGIKSNLDYIAEFGEQETGEEWLKEGAGSCSDRLINLSGEDSQLELDRKQTDGSLQGEERTTVRPDRYFFLKYSRRNGLKPNLECIAEFDVEKIGEEMLKEGEGSCSDRLINLGAEDSGLELDCKQTDCSLHREEGPTARPDRYFFLKYSRRKGIKSNLGS